MVDEQLPQVLETIADGVETKVSEAVFPEDQSLYAMEIFDCLDILVSHFSMRKVYFICVRSDDKIFDGCSLRATLGVEAQHHLLKLIELTLHKPKHYL